MSNSGVKLKARFKTRPIQQWSVGREFNRRLKAAFDEAGIKIPYPHMHLVGAIEHIMTDPQGVAEANNDLPRTTRTYSRHHTSR
jgi:small-conductance mechanosensitive channel